MSFALCLQNPRGWNKSVRRVDLNRDPSPVIMAQAIGGENFSHYWIEGDPDPDVPEPRVRVPLMDELSSIPSNGFAVVSTFSGSGGSSLGYKFAGFRVRYACEFVPDAADVYSANFPDVIVDRRDIRDVDAADILSALSLKRGELDVLDGSPPCASFSSAGARQKLWNVEKKYSTARKKQRTDDLFEEYIRLVAGLYPKTFVAENVEGFIRGKAKGAFLKTIRALRDLGYIVRARLLDAADFDVPQKRPRIFLIGARADLGIVPDFPKPRPYRVPVASALRGLDIRIPDDLIVDRFSGSKRKLSIDEVKRIGSFPDDFILSGSYAKQWERIGRAVPPLFMRAVATALRDHVLIPARDREGAFA